MESFMSPKFINLLKSPTVYNALYYVWRNLEEKLLKKKKIGSIFMDLYKAFDTADRSLLVLKLSVY